VAGKRRFPRFSVVGVRGKVSFAERVEVINMSVGGIALRTDRRLEIGREHNLMVEGRGFHAELKAVAVWSKPTTATRPVEGESVPEYTVGLRFVEVLSPETQKLTGIFKEKRLSTRFRIKAKDLVLIDVDDPCEVKLISRSGMLIQTARLFEVESVYRIEILPPEQVPIRLNGRIASQLKGAQGHVTGYDLGVEFLDMSEDDRKRLDAFIDSIPSQSGGD
jgi:c-di-GMP-binding flagellar brake protein YcgR